MNVTALVMAGGRGSRMKLPIEKPLIEIDGKTMIERIIDTLRHVEEVGEIIAAVSTHTPRTSERLKQLSVKTIETPGEDYVSDMQYSIKKLNLTTVLTISADLPFISKEHIDNILKHHQSSTKPALAVFCPVQVYHRLGLDPEHIYKVGGKLVAPVGVNVIHGQSIDEDRIEEDQLILQHEEIALNINTIKDLKIAQKWAKRNMYTICTSQEER